MSESKKAKFCCWKCEKALDLKDAYHFENTDVSDKTFCKDCYMEATRLYDRWSECLLFFSRLNAMDDWFHGHPKPRYHHKMFNLYFKLQNIWYWTQELHCKQCVWKAYLGTHEFASKEYFEEGGPFEGICNRRLTKQDLENFALLNKQIL